MRPVIIGAGRGSRLGSETDEIPKTLVQVMGRPMLDFILDALAQAGFTRSDVVFVCGYAEDVVRARYPEFTFVRNTSWQSNNILLSLLCAREHLTQGFVSTYADIVYEGAVVEKLVAAREPIVLGCDTEWRRRYSKRSLHPESDAEKLCADGRRVTRLSRHIPSDEASGEFIGVMKLDRLGASELLGAFDRAEAEYSGKVFREGREFQKAYLIDLLQHMLEGGSQMVKEDTRGGYMEIDTREDLALAEEWWNTRP
ncbi:MAG: NTP transferase domain-containing protein [Myxococcales bacterium]|nr:NTP transferase domain-containing protein [Myxococcales bacterium]